MDEPLPTPQRFGTHASAIQLLALLIAGSVMDGGRTLSACTLASLLFWTCTVSLVAWRGCGSGIDLLFLRWGLIAFAMIGTPVLRPVVEEWNWLDPVLLPGTAVLLVVPLLCLITRAVGFHSPVDNVGRDKEPRRPDEPNGPTSGLACTTRGA